MWAVQAKDAEDKAASAANADSGTGEQTGTAVQAGDAPGEPRSAIGPATSDTSAGPQLTVHPASGYGSVTNGKRHARKRVDEAGLS